MCVSVFEIVECLLVRQVCLLLRNIVCLIVSSFVCVCVSVRVCVWVGVRGCMGVCTFVLLKFVKKCERDNLMCVSQKNEFLGMAPLFFAEMFAWIIELSVVT